MFDRVEGVLGDEPIVFVVQLPLRDGKPKYNIDMARNWGLVREVFRPEHGPWDLDAALRWGAPVLAHYSFVRGDALLLMGNPVLIGISTVLCHHANMRGRVRFLQWSGERNSYDPILWVDPVPHGVPPLVRS